MKSIRRFMSYALSVLWLLTLDIIKGAAWTVAAVFQIPARFFDSLRWCARMVSKQQLQRTAISLVLISAMFLTACSQATVNKVVKMLDGVPQIVTTFALPANVASRVNQAFDEVKIAVTAYRDNPSNSTFTTALNIFDGLLARDVFNVGTGRVGSSLRGFALAARTAFSFFGPETLAEMDEDSEDGRAAKRERDKAIKDLERSFDELKDAAR